MHQRVSFNTQAQDHAERCRAVLEQCYGYYSAPKETETLKTESSYPDLAAAA